MRMHFFIKNKTTEGILVIKENGIYDLPYIISDIDDKKLLKDYLNSIITNYFKNNDFWPYSDENKEERYYFCIRPISNKSAKLLVDKFEWFSEEDTIKKINNDNASKFLLDYKRSITNPLTEEQIYEIFEQGEKIQKLRNLPIGYLTEEEAKLIGKYDLWHRTYTAVFEEVKRCLPKDIGIDIFEEELKLQGKEEFTPKIFADVYYKYKDKNSEEIRKIIKRNS